MISDMQKLLHTVELLEQASKRQEDALEAQAVRLCQLEAEAREIECVKDTDNPA